MVMFLHDRACEYGSNPAETQPWSDRLSEAWLTCAQLGTTSKFFTVPFIVGVRCWFQYAFIPTGWELLYLPRMEVVCFQCRLFFVFGWWFGTCFIFPLSWECHHPNWLSYFSEGWLNHQPYHRLSIDCPYTNHILKPSSYVFLFACGVRGFPVAHHVRQREVLGGAGPTKWWPPRNLGAIWSDLSWEMKLLYDSYILVV